MIAIFAQIIIMPRIQVRYLSEGSNDIWYRAIYAVQESVEAAPAQTLNLDIGITNTGLFEWETEGNQPVNLGYHIICRDDNMPSSLENIDISSLNYLVFKGPRTELAHNVAPNETISLTVHLVAPTTPDRYIIAWDMVQESVVWFSEKGMIPATTTLDVAGEPTTTCGTETYSQNTAPHHPSRLELWWIALQTSYDNPVLGIGASNFRSYFDSYYGEGLYIQHPHNSYLSYLLDFGIFSAFIAVLAVVWLLNMLAKVKPLIEDSQGEYIWFGICIALTSFGLHSMAESFNYQPVMFFTVATIIGLAARFSVSTQRLQRDDNTL